MKNGRIRPNQVEEKYQNGEILRTEEKRRFVMDCINDAVYKINPNGFFTYLNYTALKRAVLAPKPCYQHRIWVSYPYSIHIFPILLFSVGFLNPCPYMTALLAFRAIRYICYGRILPTGHLAMGPAAHSCAPEERVSTFAAAFSHRSMAATA